MTLPVGMISIHTFPWTFLFVFNKYYVSYDMHVYQSCCWLMMNTMFLNLCYLNRVIDPFDMSKSEVQWAVFPVGQWTTMCGSISKDPTTCLQDSLFSAWCCNVGPMCIYCFSKFGVWSGSPHCKHLVWQHFLSTVLSSKRERTVEKWQWMKAEQRE